MTDQFELASGLQVLSPSFWSELPLSSVDYLLLMLDVEEEEEEDERREFSEFSGAGCFLNDSKISNAFVFSYFLRSFARSHLDIWSSRRHSCSVLELQNSENSSSDIVSNGGSPEIGCGLSWDLFWGNIWEEPQSLSYFLMLIFFFFFFFKKRLRVEILLVTGFWIFYSF